MQVIDDELLDNIISEAKANSRLRINYNFHPSLSDKCQRLLNAMEPGTVMPIHRHEVAEMYILLRGSLTVTFHDDEKKITDSQLLDLRKGIHGVQIPPRTWHSLVVHEKGTVIFEVKEGPFIPHSIGGILE